MLQNSSAAIIEFSASEIVELNTALNAITIKGARLPPFIQAFSDVEAPIKR